MRTAYDDDDKICGKYRKEIITENREHCLNVYKALKCSRFEYYRLANLKCVMLLLSDAFEKCRRACMSSYKLDPPNSSTAPSLAWGCHSFADSNKAGVVVLSRHA